MTTTLSSATAAFSHIGKIQRVGIKRLRIGLVAPSLDILGGQGVQARGLADALSRDGIQVRFVAINPRFPLGLRWVRRIPVLRTVLNQILYLPTLLVLRQVDVVHVFSASYWSFLLAQVPAIVMARLFRKRIILNYHSGEAQDHLSNWGRRVHPWLRRVDHIVVPSRYLQKVFAQHGYDTQVIRNMVDTSAFRFRERRPLRPRLLSTRNLEPLYAVMNTLRAFVIVQQSWPDASLTIAGYGSQEQELRDWVRHNRISGVSFAGRVEPAAMPALYDRSDVFLNSSLIDNQPISILEAFAAGLPVVSTPVGDIPAMLQDGAAGCLVSRQDPEAMAIAINALLENPHEASAMALRARAEVDRYTWRNLRNEWHEVFTRTMFTRSIPARNNSTRNNSSRNNRTPS